MNDILIAIYVIGRAARDAARRAHVTERGEGVISAAIAVLIMAFLGALMWVGFKATLGNAQGNVDNQVNEIGK